MLHSHAYITLFVHCTLYTVLHTTTTALLLWKHQRNILQSPVLVFLLQYCTSKVSYSAVLYAIILYSVRDCIFAFIIYYTVFHTGTVSYCMCYDILPNSPQFPQTDSQFIFPFFSLIFPLSSSYLSQPMFIVSSEHQILILIIINISKLLKK